MSRYCSLLLVVYCFVAVEAQYKPTWDSLDSRALPSWYDEAKFGIFLHWGLYSVPSYGGAQSSGIAGEWFWWSWKGAESAWAVNYMNKNYPPGFSYADFAPDFKAEMFDPNQWAQLFVKAGAKYVVLTSKHHEGFANWPTNTSWNWNSVDVGPHRNLVGDLAAAIQVNTSLHFGLYFSQFEWFNPLYLQDKANGYRTQTYVEEVSIPQLHEIVLNYKPELIWSDGDWEAPDTYWNSTEFLAWLYNESPVKDTVVVNDRWGSGCSCKHGGYFTCSDRYHPGTLQSHKWENALTVDQNSWGFRREAVIGDFLSTEELIAQLVTTVSCGGNMLLNVGPTHDGRIVPIFEERLIDLGTWLLVNGEAIYGSKPWHYQNDTINSDVWYTTHAMGQLVFATVLKWPDNYTVHLGAVRPGSDASVTLLGYGKVQWTYSQSMMTLTMPYLPLDSPLQWAWTFQMEGVSPAVHHHGNAHGARLHNKL